MHQTALKHLCHIFVQSILIAQNDFLHPILSPPKSCPAPVLPPLQTFFSLPWWSSFIHHLTPRKLRTQTHRSGFWGGDLIDKRKRKKKRRTALSLAHRLVGPAVTLTQHMGKASHPTLILRKWAFHLASPSCLLLTVHVAGKEKGIWSHPFEHA